MKQVFIILILMSFGVPGAYLSGQSLHTPSQLSSPGLSEELDIFYDIVDFSFSGADSILLQIRKQVVTKHDLQAYYRAGAALAYQRDDLPAFRNWFDSLQQSGSPGKQWPNIRAWYEWQLGARDLALDLYDSALNKHNLKDWLTIDIILDKAEILLEKWELKQAEDLIDTAFSMIDSMEEPKMNLKARLIRDWWIYKRGDLQVSLDSAKDLKKTCLQYGDTTNLIRTHELLAQIYYHLGDYPPAIENYQQILQHHRNDANLVGVSQQLGYISYAHRMMGNFSKAIDYAKKKITVCDALSDELRKAEAYIRLYQVYHDNKQPEAALQVVDLAMEIYQKHESESGIGVAHNSYGNIYEYLKDYPKALSEYQKSLAIFRSWPKSRWVVPLYNIGHVKVLMKAYQQSIPYFEESLAICEEQFIIGMRIRNLAGLSEAYLNLNQVQLAKELIDEAVPEVMTTKYQRMKRDVYELAAEVYEKAGLYKEALGYHQLFKSQNDSLFNEASDRRFAAMEVEYQTKEKEQENQLLRQDVALKEASINSQRQWIFIAVIVLFFSLMGVFFIYRSNRSLNEKNRKIQAQQLSIEERNRQIETLLKEVHHRVKNNLQLITSLLDVDDLQENPRKAVSILEDSQSRVTTMSLIHQNLYMNDNLATIKLEQYVIDLMHNIQEIHMPEDEVYTSIDCGLLVFDVDTMVPLGLALNELLTNCFKYPPTSGGIVIRVSCKMTGEGRYSLVVKDQGNPLPKPLQELVQNGYGLRLAYRLSHQLLGTLTHEYNGGNTFTITFQDTETRRKVE